MLATGAADVTTMSFAGQRCRRAMPAIGRLLALACAGWLLPVPAASAAATAATTVTNPLISGATEIGHATLTAGYAGSAATVDVSSAAQVRLQPGALFKATICLNVHVVGTAPRARCVSSDIDTRDATEASSYAVAPVSESVERPAAGNTGYATQHVVVTDADWTLLANSWPQANLAGASVPLFAAGADSGPLPGQQGVALESTPGHGGANTALPDSMCVSNPWPPATPRPDLDTGALGTMASHYEVGEPSGTFAGEVPKGVMILFHGGGWVSNGGGAAQALRGEADRWRARGWRTVNSSYRPCGRAVGDAVSVYDRVRATYGAASPVCTLGQSAGGHLALMVAARRPGGVSCVVDQAGPVDGASLVGQGAFDPRGGGTQTDGPRAVHNMMVAAFGEENLASVSPAQLIDSGLQGTRILAVTAAEDALIPYGQMTMLRDEIDAADPGAHVVTMQLAPGDQPFVHGYVSQAALDSYRAAERDLVAPLAGGAPADPPEAEPAPSAPADAATPAAAILAPQLGLGPAPVAPPVAPPVVPPLARTPAPDRTPPRARSSAQRSQRIGPRLTVVVTCVDEPCRAVARAAVAVRTRATRRARTYRSRAVRRAIAAGARTRIVIRLPRHVAAAARRASRAGRIPTARVTVVVADSAGNRRALSRTVRLRR
ncbi:MAG: alpha/beta hydrolase family protein [Thermoleophilia bacterium]